MVLPAEHGGWSFLAEPAVLALIAAFSGAGLQLAVAALAAFLARTPLRLLVTDRRHGRRYPRTRLAEGTFAVLALVAALTLAGALVSSGGTPWPALLVATPLAGLALVFDLGRRSREAAAELVSALALGASAPAIALAAGWSPGAAFALWGVVAARSVPTIFYVRSRLRLERSQPRMADALWAQVVGVGGVALLAASRLAPRVAVILVSLLALRAAFGLSPWRPRMTTRQLGASEAVIGGVFAIGVGLGYRLGW